MPRGPIERSLTFAPSPTFTGQAKFADGSAAAPSITFASTPSMGFFRFGAGVLGVSTGSGATADFLFNGAGFQLRSGGTLGWASTDTAAGTIDAFLLRDAANILAQRNGANAQRFRVYGTYTDASNFERVDIGVGAWSSTTFSIVSQSIGTGTARPLVLATSGAANVIFGTANTARWEVNSSGHIVAWADNTYDIGASGATRPRNVYAGTGFTVDAAGDYRMASRFIIGSTGDGTIRLTNIAGTDFNRLQFGGTTGSFPALKRSGNELQLRLADDSGFTHFVARSLKIGASGNIQILSDIGTPEGAVTAPVGSIFLRTDGGAGTILYVKESGASNTGWVAK
jgi:hypothetical protein